jgi:hypothetical protein
MLGLFTQTPREEAERQLLQMVEAPRHQDFYLSARLCGGVTGVVVTVTPMPPYLGAVSLAFRPGPARARMAS